MNAMGHQTPNMLGVSQKGVEDKVRSQVPGYMAMGEKGMDEHSEHAKHMPGPENTLPMMGGDGPFGSIGMGGMFTLLKVRPPGVDLKNPGWHRNEPGTVAERVGGPAPAKTYACPMHPEVRSDRPGKCPKCGMDLAPHEHKGGEK